MSLATIILAAGKGTRMNSDIPKVLHKVKGKPMVNYCIELGNQLASEKIVVIVGYKKELVLEATENFDIEYAIQEPQLGTGHAVAQAESLLEGFDGNVLVLYGDVPLLSSKTVSYLVKCQEESNAAASILTAKLSNPTGYGRIIRNEEGYVSGIVEEKDASEEIRKIQEINSGIGVFRKKDLFDGLKLLKNDNAQGEYYLTDVFKIFANEGKKVLATIATNPNEVLGVNTTEQLMEINEFM